MVSHDRGNNVAFIHIECVYVSKYFTILSMKLKTDCQTLSDDYKLHHALRGVMLIMISTSDPVFYIGNK